MFFFSVRSIQFLKLMERFLIHFYRWEIFDFMDIQWWVSFISCTAELFSSFYFEVCYRIDLMRSGRQRVRYEAIKYESKKIIDITSWYLCLLMIKCPLCG